MGIKRKNASKRTKSDVPNFVDVFGDNGPELRKLSTEFAIKQKDLIDYLGNALNGIQDEISSIAEEYNARVNELQMIQMDLRKMFHGQKQTIN